MLAWRHRHDIALARLCRPLGAHVFAGHRDLLHEGRRGPAHRRPPQPQLDGLLVEVDDGSLPCGGWSADPTSRLPSPTHQRDTNRSRRVSDPRAPPCRARHPRPGAARPPYPPRRAWTGTFVRCLAHRDDDDTRSLPVRHVTCSHPDHCSVRAATRAAARASSNQRYLPRPHIQLTRGPHKFGGRCGRASLQRGGAPPPHLHRPVTDARSSPRARSPSIGRPDRSWRTRIDPFRSVPEPDVPARMMRGPRAPAWASTQSRLERIQRL